MMPANTGQLVGYARVSTNLQNPELQTDALQQAGCVRVFTDHASGKTAARPQLKAMLDYVREGDVIVVWKLDRLGRSIRDLINLLASFNERGISFRSITEGIDTTTPTGVLVYHILATLAQFEVDQTDERTYAGLEAARKRGRRGGRPTKITSEQRKLINELHDRGENVTTIARTVGTSRATVYRCLDTESGHRPIVIRAH